MNVYRNAKITFQKHLPDYKALTIFINKIARFIKNLMLFVISTLERNVKQTSPLRE